MTTAKQNYYVKFVVSLEPEDITHFLNNMITMPNTELICFERTRWTE